MILHAALLLVASSVTLAVRAQPDISTVAQPFEIRMSAHAAAEWTSFKDLPKPAPDGKLRIAVAQVPTSPARIDVLHRVNGVWALEATYEWSPEIALPTPPTNGGILLRQRGVAAFYGWTEVEAEATGKVELRMFRNVFVRGVSNESLIVFVGVEPEPRLLRETDVLRFIPPEPLLLCATSARGDRCLALGAQAYEADLDGIPLGEIRVLCEPHDGAEIAVLRPGNSALRPRKVAATLVRAGTWIGVTLQDSSVPWPGVLLHRTALGHAIERLDGASLLALPAFTTVPSSNDFGVVIQPHVGGEKYPLTDRNAMLVVFPASGAGVSTSVPLATAVLNDEGTFAFPTLASGTYAWKLLSSEAAGDVMIASVRAGAPHELIFPTGPMVTGRVVRLAGGGTLERPSVKVILQQPPSDHRSGDVVDAARIVDTDENGGFRIVLLAVGEYRLLARWGAASAERQFQIKSKSDVRDLGEIPLQNDSTLRGSMPPCPNGEVVVALLPDLHKPLALGLDDPQRTRTDDRGQFLFEGLRPGTWTIGAKCNGVFVPLRPEIVVVVQHADTVIELVPGQ